MKLTKKMVGVSLLVLLFSNMSYGAARVGTKNNNAVGISEKTKKNFSVQGVDQKKSITANGENVNVQGSSNTVTVKGKVSTLNVQGEGNTVYVDSVEKIVLQGVDNKVVYKTSPTKSGQPNVTNSGVDNSVTKR